MSKLGKMKSFITSLFGIKEYKLNTEGKLDISAEDYARLNENYGAEFITRFEKMLGEEAVSVTLSGQDLPLHLKEDTKQAKIDMNLTLLCALLSVQAISIVDGKATLSEEQLGKIEAGLKKLSEEKSAAESNLTTAKTEKDTAVNALSAVTSAMDELDTTVAAAKTSAEKVDAIRKKLAAKPGSNNTGIQGESDNVKKELKGTDEVNSYVNSLL